MDAVRRARTRLAPVHRLEGGRFVLEPHPVRVADFPSFRSDIFVLDEGQERNEGYLPADYSGAVVRIDSRSEKDAYHRASPGRVSRHPSSG